MSDGEGHQIMVESVLLEHFVMMLSVLVMVREIK